MASCFTRGRQQFVRLHVLVDFRFRGSASVFSEALPVAGGSPSPGIVLAIVGRVLVPVHVQRRPIVRQFNVPVLHVDFNIETPAVVIEFVTTQLSWQGLHLRSWALGCVVAS